MALYHSLSLDKGLTAQAASAPLTRHDAMYLFYNLLSAKNKEGQPYLTTLGYSLNAAGEVDLVALVNGEMNGPLVASGDWQSAIPFPLSGVTVTRDGKASTLAAIQTNDVIYWNQTMRALWVSSDRVVGVIQELTPSASSPESGTAAPTPRIPSPSCPPTAAHTAIPGPPTIWRRATR